MLQLWKHDEWTRTTCVKAVFCRFWLITAFLHKTPQSRILHSHYLKRWQDILSDTNTLDMLNIVTLHLKIFSSIWVPSLEQGPSPTNVLLWPSLTTDNNVSFHTDVRHLFLKIPLKYFFPNSSSKKWWVILRLQLHTKLYAYFAGKCRRVLLQTCIRYMHYKHTQIYNTNQCHY